MTAPDRWQAGWLARREAAAKAEEQWRWHHRLWETAGDAIRALHLPPAPPEPHGDETDE